MPRAKTTGIALFFSICVVVFALTGGFGEAIAQSDSHSVNGLDSHVPPMPDPAKHNAPGDHPESGGLLRAWDIHPALVHFPIAFLLLGFFVDVLGRRRPSVFLGTGAASLYIAGVSMGALSAVSGLVALLTAPRMADPGNMVWLHPIAAAVTMGLFLGVAIVRWRTRFGPPSKRVLAASLVGTALLVYTGWLGADLTYRHGFGVTPEGHGPTQPVSPPPENQNRASR